MVFYTVFNGERKLLTGKHNENYENPLRVATMLICL